MRLSSILIFAAATLGSRAAVARDVASEPSRYGHFELTLTESSGKTSAKCRLAFVGSNGKRKQLFTVPDCIGDISGMNTLGATEAADKIRLPAMIGDTEFHLFEIAGARGGNATDATDYWAVAVTPKGPFSAKFSVDTIDSATLLESKGALVVEQAPTTTSKGARNTIKARTVGRTVLAVVASRVVSQKKQELVGTLGMPSHVTAFCPTIRVGSEDVIMSSYGACPLRRLWDDEPTVRMNAEITEYSDGRRIVRCLSVTAVPAS